MDSAAQKLEPDGLAVVSLFRGQAETGPTGLILCHLGLTQFTERSLSIRFVLCLTLLKPMGTSQYFACLRIRRLHPSYVPSLLNYGRAAWNVNSEIFRDI